MREEMGRSIMGTLTALVSPKASGSSSTATSMKVNSRALTASALE